MDINYFMKIQNAYGTKNRREKELAKINNEMSKHFEDTYDTVDILLNGTPTQLMIIKDTDNNTFKKKIKSVHGDKFNLGDYVEWNNQKWLITLVDADERTWNRGYMYLCTVPLRWQNSDGKIIERYVYAEDFTKYSNGVTGNNTITIGDNQYGLTLPVDDETKKLKRDMRFPVDFDDSDQPDIYKLTNRKVKLSDNQYFGRGGTMIVTMSFDAFNPNHDKKVTMENGQEVWICNYNNSHSPLPPTLQPPDETTDLRCMISGNPNLKNGYKRPYTVTFTDKDGNAIDWQKVNFSWKVIADFNIIQSIYSNKIDLFVDKEDLIGSSFLLQIIYNNSVAAKINIAITE
ncbi:hypothetical protein NSB25_25895 [Acetatifactor muris]|uniref:Uncharacterized protein n=1 Tax=Acetatifactor muris TaxID=879566 RepID=A0A2K4ZP12_9FIRM|nr:hypothetical protein [Acetatifactor muris]MCR2050670.1 hypothetical protein [Acetatifactor muris]SOY32217.1 hypothetical protein AMURIS_04975 [Acetatifactor muris]